MSSPTYRMSGMERGDEIASQLFCGRMYQRETAAVVLGETRHDSAGGGEREEGAILGDDFHIVSILCDLWVTMPLKNSQSGHRSS